MKKTVISIIASLVALSFVGCEGETGPQGPSGASGTVISKDFQYGVAPDAGYTFVEDTYIYDLHPGYNYGKCSGMVVGNGGGGASRALLKFDLGMMNPANVTVLHAYLTLFPYNVTQTISMTAYALTTAWDEGGGDCAGMSTAYAATWNFFTSPGGDYDSGAPASNTIVRSEGAADQDDPLRFELVAARVQGWIRNPSTNKGIIIRTSSESTVGDYLAFPSNETTWGAGYRPKLTIIYQIP